MSIGTTIKKLRREREITQEQLAEYLGISASAVSQWECDKSCPDVSQLPILANIFDVTTDEILSVNIRNNEEKIEKISKEAWDFFDDGMKERATELLNEGLREFPNSHKLMMDLAEITYCNAYSCAADKERMMDISLSLSERVISESADIELKARAIRCCVDVYTSKGNAKEAEKYALMLPEITRNVLLSSIYKGNRLAELYKNKMVQEQLTNGLIYAELLAYLRDDDGRELYTDDEKLMILGKIVDIYGILYEDGDFDFFFQFLSSAHDTMAGIYARRNDKEKTLSHLEASVKFAIMFETYDFDHVKTSLLFRGLKDGGWVRNSPGEMSDAILSKPEKLAMPHYDFIREDERFKKLEAEVREFIGE